LFTFLRRLDRFPKQLGSLLLRNELAGFDDFRSLLLNRRIAAAGIRLLGRVAAASRKKQDCAERKNPDDVCWSHEVG
jgi:hypothetical protein